jgi:tetrahydromethanopterin S-methyltransferase subunit E
LPLCNLQIDSLSGTHPFFLPLLHHLMAITTGTKASSSSKET